jgi:predicted amidophosphoribosyltransferase
MPETKICDNCDQEIGATETKCPKCGIEFEELEAEVGAVSRCLTVIEKRKAREKTAADKKAAEEAAKNPPPKKHFLASLNRSKKGN